MKCVRCGTTYDERALNACPQCAREKRWEEVLSGVRGIGLLLIALVTVPILLVMCSR